MGRAPCCEKMGLKKGPWTPEEDQILINYVQKHGHSNWRALPKLAGLLRCGKSCRLRWINYLRPDIKRGNFTKEEEDTIIQLHEMLGNRWSAIAAKLPGRTDNEIKNVWHTHIKKKNKQKNASKNQQFVAEPKCGSNQSESTSNSIFETKQGLSESSGYAMSPQPSSCTENSSFTDASIIQSEKPDNVNVIKDEYEESWENFPVIDDAFWSETEFVDYSSMVSSSSSDSNHFQFDSTDNIIMDPATYDGYVPDMDDGMDFWYNIFIKTGGIQELL